ncbi:DUF6480 family protein [Streptomyces wuyuanensis]|uniref:DUF6480 family protein n=1 Tax=Streptomyces wuyuanensis TaxID=1196353 RepID=UPI003D72B147
MTDPLLPPAETPPAEDSMAEAHPERPDGDVWDHPGLWLSLIVIGCLLVAAFFGARILGL